MKNKRVFRALLSVLLALTMLVQLVPMSVFAQSSVLYGDVNSDGAIDNIDVDLLARYLSNDTSVEIDKDAADVDRSGAIDLNDLLYLVKLVNGADISLGQTATVTFDTNGGTAIDPITVVAGSTITAPEAQKDNAVFLGWYTDEALTTPFYSSDPIVQDVTVYAKYAQVSGEPEYTPAAFALQDQPTDLVFNIQRVSGELAPQNAVTLISADGSVAPKLTFTESGENKWKVSAEGGYTEGASYTLTLAEGYTFEGKDESIREASFYIYKEEVANFTTNEDIIYIQDTATMTYTLSDGTTCEVLDSAVLYNSDDVITGSFSYTKAADLHVGDTLCIYVTTSPTERDYIDGNYDNDPTAYIVVETISGNTVTFRGMTMQGDNSDVEKLISLPSTIPFSVLNLPAGDGTVNFNDRDLAALITMYNTGAPDEVKVGDFLAFYVGNFGSLREGDPVAYKRVTAVNGSTITYVKSSQEELLNAINLFLASDVEGEKMIENIDQGQLEQQVMQQVEQTGFAEDALEYLSGVVGSSDEFYDYVADNKITVYDENGVKLTEEQIKAYGLGNSFELADDVELSFNVTTCDGENSHFENGIKVTLNIGAEFEVDIGKDGKMGSLKIELGAAFTQEVCIDVNINATADITWIVCIPKINDIVFSSAVDVMSYTGVSIEAKFYTQEASEDFFDKLEENWGDKLGEDAMKKIKEFKKKYEDKFEEDSLGEDIEGFWESQTALIEDLITNGEITKEQAESCLESHSENHIVQTFFSKAHLMNDEDYNAGITELAERYADMLGEEDNGWLELCKIKIFDVPINLWIFQISIEGNFVVRANVNIALGANLEYEIGKRYINWFSIFGNGSGAEKLDLVDERFAFQFYAMGHVGLKAGILIEIKVGIISTKIGNVGISAEVGAYAELYGYFQYTYTKTRPSGGKDWEEDESLMGALYFEFGLYVDINVKAELLSLLEKEWELYSEKWELLSAGSKSNIYGFATELKDGEKIVVADKDNNSTNGIHYQLSEDFRSMKTLDMVSGDQDNVVKPWISYYGYNFWGGDDYSLTQHEDKTNFTYTLSSKYFSLVPVYEEKDGKQYIVDYEIQVDVPENVHYLTCDLRLVWTLDKLCWSKYDMAITIPLVWTDLAEEELTEYRTATVKVGNEADGYRTVWSERYIKGSTFELPSEETVLELADFAGDSDVRYSGYTGYSHTNRGEQIDNTEQSMIFDTIYYFDMTTRQYSITVKGVQNTDGSTKNMTFKAKYGEKFDFSELIGTGMENGDNYTIFSGLETRLLGIKTHLDPTQEIKGNFATALLNGLCTYHAKYVRNCGEVTYKFDGIDLEPITKIYKKGEMPSSNDFIPAIDAFVGSDIAYVSSVSPTINPVLGDVVYSVTVTLPEKEPEKYTITYESNGGSAVASQTVEERAAMLPPSNPTRTGYTFAGWYYEADFVTPVSWDRSMPSMNFTLWAKWTANNYKITFNAGEGTATGSSLDVTYDKTLGALPTATRANYIFTGWYTAASGGTQYTADTVYKNTSNITLYAHWQIKATVASSNVTITNKTTTYNGSGVTLAMSNNLGLNMSSFTVSYKRQNLDRNWSTALPVNAGTYDVRIQRAEDDKYLACEHTYTGKLVIKKASRTISSSGLTATVVGGNLSVTSVPSYPGDGTQMFALGSGSFGTSGGFTNLNGTYQVKFYVAEGENYLASNTVSTGNITVGTPYQPIDMKPTYKVDSYTQDELGAGTSKTVKVWLIHTDGSESSKTSLSNIDKRGDSSTDTLYPVYDDPWKLYRIKYQIDGSSNDWDCGGYKLYAVVNGSSKTLKSEGSNGSSELFMLDNSASHYRELGSFKRNVTGVGNFSGNVNLSLSSSDGLYTFTYNGTVVDQYKSWSTSGSGYNAFYHTDAPTLTLSCSKSTINGFNYAQYFRSNLNTITIDRAGLYKAMVRDGVTSISATATLTFNSGSTASGNTWTKTFNISVPATASVSEGMDTYYTSGEGNVTVQTQEDEAYLYVTMGLNSNPGIWGIKNTVAFDTTALELVSATEGSLASDYKIKTTTADGKYTLLAYRDGIKESYATGSFVTLTFKKKVETVDPDTAITLTNDQTIDDQAQAVNIDSIFHVGDFTSVPPSDENQYLTDADTIVDTLHAGFGNKNTATQTFYYKTTELVTEETLSGWFHTAKDRLSRYDSFGIKRYAATASKYTKNSEFYYTITYTVEYYLTADQEIALDTKIGAVLNGLNLSGKTDLEKVTAIYAYLCENVTYDENATNCFTAYGALLDGRAVCQGYALAMMRLLNAAGLEEADVVLGTSSDVNHMWNVVKLDGEYFLLDATWDSEREEECYAYFLKGSDDFANHTPTESYTVTLSTDDHEKAFVLSHSFASTWSRDNTNHWYDCANCDAVNEKTAHTDLDFDHACDGGCDIVLGEHKDDNKDHICDYGCNASLVAPTYVVTIPATVNEGEELTICADGVVLYDTEVLTVTVNSDFTLKTAEGAQLPYTLGGLTDGAVALAVTGNGDPAAPVSDTKSYKVEVAEEAKYSGTYTGTVTFTIAVNSAVNN